MNKPTRKPGRRFAWSMLLGGLGVAAVMLGVGAYVVNVKGVPAGPGQSATWPAGTEISVDRPFGPQPEGTDDYSVFCTVTPQSGEAMRERLDWGRDYRPYFAGSATITCDQPVRVLTEPYLTIASNTRGPLVFVPLFAAALGVLFFFPRFTYRWARYARNPFAFVADLVGGDRRDRFI